jgi:uncharacterized protein with ParB-like and HNH nuclease domain
VKITCIDKEIKQILETGYYQIPRFQRPYSWEKDNINEFLHDAIIESETDYFIGSFVVYKSTPGNFGIVDGQQRLTTITMILCALRDFYINENFDDDAKGIHNLIERSDIKNQKQFILQTETSYPYLQEHIQKYSDPEIEDELNSEEENLKFGFNLISEFFRSIINEIKNNRQLTKEQVKKEVQGKLDEIRDKVLQLKVIYIELDDEEDAYIIFETLNTRGKDLSVSDLAKNYLTKLIKTKNPKVDLPKDKWNKIRETIDSSTADIDTDTFLFHVWLSKYQFTTLKTLFKKLKTTVKQSNAKSFLDELVADSTTYKSIFDPETKKWNKNEFELKQSLLSLLSFRVNQQTPMVLAVLRAYNKKEIKLSHAIESLKAIEHFHYIFTAITSQRSSGGISSMYSYSARELFNAKDMASRVNAIKDLKQSMRDKLPLLEEFTINFRNLKFTNDFTKYKKIIQYTLSKYDSYYNTNGSSVHYDRMTIEHLLPQNPAKKLPNHDETVGMIGNLILADDKTNGKLDNKDFANKKKILTATTLYIDKKIQDATKWEPREIIDRTDAIAKLAYTKVFKI